MSNHLSRVWYKFRENSGINGAFAASFSAKDAIKIEDIDWNVSNAIMDVEMTFNQKEGTTIEELSSYDELKEKRSWTEDDMKKLYILGYNRKYAEPGKTVTDSPCVINGTYTMVESMEQYNVMEPTKVSIAFVGADGKGYAVYYDFKTQTYGESTQGAMNLHEWSESEISKLLPKADCKAVHVSSDEDDRFFFYAYGVGKTEFEAYVKQVKEKGFTTIKFENSTSYRATNADGIEAHITYNAIEEKMSGSVEKG